MLPKHLGTVRVSTYPERFLALEHGPAPKCRPNQDAAQEWGPGPERWPMPDRYLTRTQQAPQPPLSDLEEC